MAYQDLVLRFHAAPDSERYRLVTFSPTEGQVSAPFVSPFGEERVNTWRHGLDPDEMHMIGTLLYRRVFSPDVQRALEATRRFAARQGYAVRLKLILDAPLMALPWEFLYEPETNAFLTLDQRVALVRYFDLPAAPSDLDLKRAFGIFAFAPDCLAPLAREPFMSLARQTALHIQWLGLNLENDAPNAAPHQVLHLQAASGYDPADGRPALKVPNGAAQQWLSVEKIARWLHAHPSVRLVILDASSCPDATTRQAAAFAAELVERQLVPAAVAFQYPLAALLRAAFWNAFYRALARGDGLDLAVTEGRQTIAAMDGAWEWGAPVIYSALRADQPHLGWEHYATGMPGAALPAPTEPGIAHAISLRGTRA